METFGEVMVREPYKPQLFDDGRVIWRLVMFKDAPRIDFHIQLHEDVEKEIHASEFGGWYIGMQNYWQTNPGAVG